MAMCLSVVSGRALFDWRSVNRNELICNNPPMLDRGAIEKGGDHVNGRQGTQSEVQHRIVLPQIPIVAAGFTVADQLLSDFSCPVDSGNSTEGADLSLW